MENFRPPAMDEVGKQQLKKRYLIYSITIFSILIIGLGSYFGIKKLTIYLNYLSVEEKYQLLSKYYKSVIKKDTELLKIIAPEVVLTNQYNFLKVSGSYALYIYPEIQTNEDNLLFTIIDHSTTPSISYLKEVTYGYDTNNNEILIKHIAEIGLGRQID